MFKHFKDDSTGQVYTVEDVQLDQAMQELRQRAEEGAEAISQEQVVQTIFQLANPVREISHDDMMEATATKPEELAANLLIATRSRRAAVFASLAGHQSQALADGDSKTAKAISKVQTALASITDLDLSGYKTAEQMIAAMDAEWARIKAMTPEAVQSAFG